MTTDTTWLSGGVLHHCTDTQSPGESVEDFVQRHLDHINADLLIYPKDSD